MKCIALAALVLPLAIGCSSDPAPVGSPGKPAKKPLTEKELVAAIAGGDKEKVSAAIKAGADVNALVTRDGTPLHMAVMLDRPEIVEVLLDAKADIDAATELGMTPLLTAIYAKRSGIAQTLIKRGAKVDVANSAGTTALIMAATNKLEDVAISLIDARCDVRAATKSHGTTALMMAASNDLRDLAKKLIEKGADAKVTDEHGKSALDYAKTVDMRAILGGAKKP